MPKRLAGSLFDTVTEWQQKLEILGIKAKNISMLGYNGKVSFSKKGNAIVISSPVINPSNNPNPYAWVYKVHDAF